MLREAYFRQILRKTFSFCLISWEVIKNFLWTYILDFPARSSSTDNLFSGDVNVRVTQEIEGISLAKKLVHGLDTRFQTETKSVLNLRRNGILTSE